MNTAQRQFVRSFSLATVSILVAVVCWEYFPATRVWLPILLIAINARGILREIANVPNARARLKSNGVAGLASRKPWIVWVMGLYGIAAVGFFILAMTRKIDVSDMGALQFFLMFAPLGIPGTVIYFENLGDK